MDSRKKSGNCRNISRRNTLKLGGAVGIAASIPLIEPFSPAFAAKKGGHLRAALAHGSTTDTLDPAHFENGFMWAVSYGVFNYLTEIAQDGSLIGELAESWEPNAAATVWTFNLRKGVQFHDGKELDSGDVIASINHHRGEQSKSGVKKLVADVEDIVADGKLRVIIKLKSGNVDLPAIFAGQSFPIMKSVDGKIDFTAGIGTGAFKLEKFIPGQSAELSRNPNYWKSDRGHFDRVSLLSVPDSTARSNALITGTVDAIDGVELKTVNRLKAKGTVNVASVTGNLHYTFSMHTNVAPFNDAHVRMALKHAVDRDELVKKILNGFGSPGNDHPIGPAYQFYAADIEQRSFDPDKASWHLKQAGIDKLDVSLSAADAAYSGAVDAALLYAGSAKQSGINIDVVREPNDGYWSNVWLKKPWCAVFWGGQPTAGAMLELAYSAGSDWNDTKWSNDRFNELLKASKTEIDHAKRKELFREMQLLIRDDGGAVVPMYADYVIATSKKLAWEKLGGRLSFDDYRFAERWWFDA